MVPENKTRFGRGKSGKQHPVFFVLMVSVCLFNGRAIGQTSLPTAGSTPTKAKRTVPGSVLKPGEFDYSMRGAHERQMREEEEKRKKGIKIPEYGVVGRVPILAAPSNFKIVAENGFAYLSWDSVPSKEVSFNDSGKLRKGKIDASYIVYISEDGKKFRKRIEGPVHKTNVLVDGLVNGKTYYFGISTIGGKRDEMTVQSVVSPAATPGTFIDWRKIRKH